MNAPHPAVQRECGRARRLVCGGVRSYSDEKRIANRRHRRALNRKTRGFVRDPDRFDREDFAAPTLSSWDIA